MKKNLFLAGLSILALVSCSQDELVEYNKGKCIDFRTAFQTRAVETTTANLSEFKVSAVLSNGTYFRDVQFTKNPENVFVSTDEYLWPSEDLHFYAYAPVTGFGTLNGTDVKKIDNITLGANTKDQKDLITAVAVGKKALHEASGCPLQFKHQLSQIEIQAKNTSDKYKYTVKGIKIANIPLTATSFTFDEENGAGTWVLVDEKETIAETYDGGKTTVLGAEPVSIMPSENAMLFPMQLKKWVKSDNEQGNYLAVYVNIESKDGAKVYPKSADEFGWTLVPIETKWEAGKKYVYILDFTNGAGIDEGGSEILGQPIKFTVKVDGWSNEPQNINDLKKGN